MPATDVGNRMLSFLQFSPDGKKIAAVCGNLTQKSVYVANFPPSRPSDYRVIAEFSNCYKVDGLSWNHADPTQLSCKVTEIQCRQKLPGIITEQEWRKLGKNKIVQEKDFAGYLCIISESGEKPRRICSSRASLRENDTAATAWTSDETVFCCDEGRIDKCSIALGKAKTIYDVTSKEQKPRARKGLHGLAWNPDRHELVTLEYHAREGHPLSLVSIRFDSEGKIIGQDVPIPSAIDAGQLGFVRLDGAGESLVANNALFKASGIFYGKLNSEEHRETPMPSGEMFVPICLNISGTAVVAFSNQKPGFSDVERQHLPTMDDFSYRVVSVT